MGGVWNTVKGESTVPLKFEVFQGAAELTDTSAITGSTQQKVVCGTGEGIGAAIAVTSTGGTSLRYDTGAGQFIQNWKTPKTPGACYLVTMTTADRSAQSCNEHKREFPVPVSGGQMEEVDVSPLPRCTQIDSSRVA